MRYTLDDGSPVERFVKFIRMSNHTAAEMEKIVLDTLIFLKIPFEDMRGQSYDNASNMSGKYGGLETKIKMHNPLAMFVPCSSHSLNLVDTAANCCTEVTKFFMFVEKLYVFLLLLHQDE